MKIITCKTNILRDLGHIQLHIISIQNKKKHANEKKCDYPCLQMITSTYVKTV